MFLRKFSRFIMGDLSNIANVDLDNQGIFKYILIKISNETDSKLVVRGYKRCDYHADILDEFRNSVNKNLKIKCLGGGRINKDSEKQNILVYGYSQGFGQADHQKTVELLKNDYSNYKISYSNDGY